MYAYGLVYKPGWYTDGPQTQKLYDIAKMSLFIEILDPKPKLHKILLSIDENYMPVEKNIFKLDSRKVKLRTFQFDFSKWIFLIFSRTGF